MKKSSKAFISLTTVLIVCLGAAGNYFYNYAVVPSKKDFLTSDKTPFGQEKSKMEKNAFQWFQKEQPQTRWSLKTPDDLTLSAIYLSAKKKSNKTAILAHGYMKDASHMGTFAKMYRDMGYNVLVPDARGHGQSQGDYIGFGWHERKDYLKWINRVIQENGKDTQIVLHGISMGGATVMMTSGENLSPNVKAIVEDCGYTSVNEELGYQLKQLFHLPSFPLIQVTSMVTKVRAGYFFGEASAVEQLKKNKTPILFIHGDKDDFVPYEMLDKLYHATSAPKEKYIVAGANHGDAYFKNPEKYQDVVQNFLNNFVF